MTTLHDTPVSVESPSPPEGRPSALRAWCALVLISWQRQARARQMVWIALGLLALATAVVVINTARMRYGGLGHWNAARPMGTSEVSTLSKSPGDRRAEPGASGNGFTGTVGSSKSGWGMYHWRHPRGFGPTFDQWNHDGQLLYGAVFRDPAAQAFEQAVFGAARVIVAESGFIVFARWMVFSIFLSFLLPVWSLSFATEALGGDREANSMGWLLTRPLPRPAIYLAKFVAVLPWSIGLNVGGFAILCFAGGQPGLLAFRLFWPAVVWASLAFVSLFFLMGATFRRPAVLAILYAFFLETVLGNMPGDMKRISIGFYTRCLMFDAAQVFGVEPEKPEVFRPVDGSTAQMALIGLTILFLVIGMAWFARKEYGDVV